MNNPPPQSASYADAPDDSRSISEAGSTGSWGSEASNEDSDECEVDSLADEGCADGAYWEEDTAADAWLARFPGGTSVLYPQLFVVKPRGGKVLTPSRYPNNDFLLHLPSEIRNRIYRHYFDRDEEVKRPEERHVPFRDREGIEMQRICLSSENVELKFWLSTALLQTSRQLRFEAMFIFFSNRVITVEWLPVLPRFVEFLGKEGCAMVRYLDIWDTLNHQGDDNAGYRDIITSIMHFSGLQRLRIVVSWGMRRSGLWSDRTYLWFDQNEWKHNGTLTKQAVPKMRSKDIERYWPEYEVLKNLKAQKFTLAVETPWADRYLEFDRSHGAYPGISESMQSHAAHTQSAPSSANLATSISPQALGAFEAIEIQPRGSVLTPNTEFDDEDSDSPTWQETDTLANKTIPFYNFLREFFHNNLPLGPVRGEMSVDNFVAFPTARKSRGSIMRDCAFCYLSERHCGHHAVPDQPPFEPTRLEGDGEEEDVKTLEMRFEDLSYVDMREACRDVVQWMEDVDNLVDTRLFLNVDATELLNIAAIFDYLGWPEIPNSERLARLDAAAEAGWVGRRVDKDEVPPWDVLYREVHSRYSYRYSFRGEARSS
ncbi:hypothetical protein BDZ45DRAFT_751283 [Acephala macrosclerotiorum]|nr:hypothetical protein BDZ45DRAFT_751283 [Acephala macrosclerotiorum]